MTTSPPSPFALEARGLSLRFGARVILDQLDLELAPGERVGLVGDNGAGKSTLLRAITGRLPLQRGTIQLDGQDLGGRSPAARARAGLAVAFQGEALAPALTVAAHFRLAGVDPVEASTRVGLLEVLERPVGSIDRSARRRLGVALALAARPRVLLLDEPFAGLPSAARPHVLAALDAARAAGAAVLWVEHERGWLAERVDRVLELRDGRLEDVRGEASEPAPPSDPGVDEPHLLAHGRFEPAPETASAPPRPPGLFVDLEVLLDGGEVQRIGPLTIENGERAWWPEAGGPVAAALLGLRPARGRFELGGRSVPADAVRRRLGVAGVLDPPRLVADMTIREHLSLARDPGSARECLRQLLPDAESRRRVAAGRASGGERRLLAIALAACDAPAVLILEEAGTGLAPEAAAAVARLLDHLRSRGTMVLFVGPSTPPPASAPGDVSERARDPG